jgi:hypothetical protein
MDDCIMKSLTTCNIQQIWLGSKIEEHGVIGMQHAYEHFLSENLLEKSHLEDLGVDGKY